jgi:saccharopine dehydrogenase-like NADP-dependent oxidoreductase
MDIWKSAVGFRNCDVLLRILVLGTGMQGSATVQDMVRSSKVDEVVACDQSLRKVQDLVARLKTSKIKGEQVDATNQNELVTVMKGGFDVVACLLPAELNYAVARAAVDARVNMVDVSYPGRIYELDAIAKQAGIAIIPGCGLDPGIDLVIYGYGCTKLDRVYEIHSYCGGIPQREYTNEPLRYKISWTWEGVLSAYTRKAKILKEGRVVEIENIFDECVKTVRFPEPVGEAECFLNGDATVYKETLGLRHVREMTRWTVRWPGHSELWSKLLKMKLLSDEPLQVAEGTYVTPRQFMIKHLSPQLQYKKGEGDLVVLRVEFAGEKGGEATRLIFDLVDVYDPRTGISAMARTTGYTCSVVSQMVGSGQIRGKGVLAPERDIPFEPFFQELASRGIKITEATTTVRTMT